MSEDPIDERRGLTRRRLLSSAAWAGAGAAGLGLWRLGRGPTRAGDVAASPAGTRLSLLVVGDSGAPPKWVEGAPAWRVGDAIAAEARRSSADALVLLGDNFYDSGLQTDTFTRQVRDNLVAQFRPFVELTPQGAEELGEERVCGGCRPIPIHAVLGNHDYASDESPALQRDLLPELVANWHMPKDLAGLVELGEGVSLLLFDCIRWDDGVPERLLELLRASQGPFRILASHYPMADTGHYFYKTFTRDLHKLMRKAEVPVQLYLSGHEHNLQILRMPPPAPPLHVIAGGGSYVREISPTPTRRDFAAAELGFARVDLVGPPGGAGVLEVTLFRVPRWPWQGSARGQAVATARVDAAGTVSVETGFRDGRGERAG